MNSCCNIIYLTLVVLVSAAVEVESTHNPSEGFKFSSRV